MADYPRQWEYDVRSIYIHKLALDSELGDEGWEVCTVASSQVISRRPKGWAKGA